MKLFKRPLVWLVLILVLSFCLRIFNINTNPPGLYGDELTLVYDAYSIGQTGRAQTGEWFPFTMTLADHRPPGYVYATVPFTWFLGSTPLAARLPSVLAGVGLSWLAYLIGKQILNRKFGLWAALVMAILPWDISISRAAFESHLALFFLTLGIYSYVQGLQKSWWWVISALVFGASFNTYSTYKLFVPLTVGLLVLITGWRTVVNRKVFQGWRLLAGLVGLIWLTIFVFQAVNGSEGRLGQLSIFNNPQNEHQIVSQVNQDRSLVNLPLGLAEIFHNKVWGYGQLFSQVYFSLFSPNFLLFEGDRSPRHNMFISGPILWVELGLLLIGLVYFWNRQRNWGLFWGGLLLLSPIPSALTGEVHYLRSSLMILPLTFLIAAGVIYLVDRARQSNSWLLISAGIVVVGAIQLISLLEGLYLIYPQRMEAFWSVPAKQISQQILDLHQNYEMVLVADKIDNIEFAYPVYAQVQPRTVIEARNQPTLVNNIPFKKIDNVYIGPINKEQVVELLNQIPGKVLIVAPGSYIDLLPGGTVYYSKNNQPIWVEYHHP